MSRAVCPTRNISKQHHGTHTHREVGPTKADRNRLRLEQSEPISVWKGTQERQESLPPNTSTSAIQNLGSPAPLCNFEMAEYLQVRKTKTSCFCGICFLDVLVKDIGNQHFPIYI